MRLLIIILGFLLSINSLAAEEAGAHDHHNMATGQTEEECLALGRAHDKIMCLQPLFMDRLGSESAASLIEEAARLQGERKIDDCHHIAHNIGKKLFDTKATVEEAFSECSHSCIDGCFHGVLQKYIPSLDKETEDLVNGMPDECRKLSDAIKDDNSDRRYRQCIHGLGHGLVLKYGEDTSLSSSACMLLPDTIHQDWCLGGVFMEKLHPFAMLEKKQLAAAIPGICNAEEQSGNRKILRICLDALGEALAFATGHNMPQSWSLCRRLPAAHQQICSNAAIAENQANQRRIREINNRNAEIDQDQ